MINLICDKCHHTLSIKINLKNLNSQVRLILSENNPAELKLQAYGTTAINPLIEIISYRCDSCRKVKSIDEIYIWSNTNDKVIKASDAEIFLFPDRPWNNLVQEKSNTTPDDIKKKHKMKEETVIVKVTLNDLNWKRSE